MRRTVDLTGRVFGSWKVLRRAPGVGKARWLCRCVCPRRTTREVLAASLLNGKSISCGLCYSGRKSVLDRFWEKVDVRGPDECWPWLGATAKGYGRFSARPGHVMSAPQFAWELAHAEPFPEGMDAAHSCNNRLCCNEAHIEAQTRQQNIKYAGDLGRLAGRKYFNSTKTHCVRGHKFTPGNTLYDRGRRVCRKCRAIRRAKYRRR